MQRLSSIEKLLNSVSPIHSSVSLNVVEQPISIDTSLSGTVRFARKIGSFVALIEPENQMLSSKAVQQNDTKIPVQFSLTQWFKNWNVNDANGKLLSCIVRIGNEFNKLYKIDSDNNIVYLEEGLLKSYDKNINIDLYGVPLVVSLALINTEVANINNYTIQIESLYPIMNNDIIMLQWQTSVISCNEYKVTKAILKEKTSTLYRYYVEIENDTDFKNIILDSETITNNTYVEVLKNLVYLKAYPAYESRLIPTPLIASKAQLGIFCIDYMSGTLYAFEQPFEDFLNVRLKTETGFLNNYGAEDSYTTIEKNLTIPNCIASDKVIVWDKVQGHMNVDTDTFIQFIPNNEGETCFKIDIEPFLTTPCRWTCKFYSDQRESKINPAQVTIQLFPNQEIRHSIMYNTTGYEVAIEVVNENIIAKGIVQAVSEIPSFEVNDVYLLQNNYACGIAKYIGITEFGYWHTYTPKVGTTYYCGGTYYRFTQIDNFASWVEIEPCEAIQKIIISTKSQYPIKMGPWLLKDNQVKDIEYQIVSHVFGKSWLSSGLILKPLMKSVLNLKGAYNSALYNNGYIYAQNKNVEISNSNESSYPVINCQ